LPFNWKLMPAAFPAFTTTSPVARTEVCAGAIRVSSATGLPSAVIETQLVFSARISSVNVLEEFAETGAVSAANEELSRDKFAAVAAPGALVAGDGAFGTEVVPGESFPDCDAAVASEVFAAFSGAAELVDWAARAGGVATSNFDAVQVGDKAVVVLHPQIECVEGRRIGDVERNPDKRRRIDSQHRALQVRADQAAIRDGAGRGRGG